MPRTKQAKKTDRSISSHSSESDDHFISSPDHSKYVNIDLSGLTENQQKLVRLFKKKQITKAKVDIIFDLLAHGIFADPNLDQEIREYMIGLYEKKKKRFLELFCDPRQDGREYAHTWKVLDSLVPVHPTYQKPEPMSPAELKEFLRLNQYSSMDDFLQLIENRFSFEAESSIPMTTLKLTVEMVYDLWNVFRESPRGEEYLGKFRITDYSFFLEPELYPDDLKNAVLDMFYEMMKKANGRMFDLQVWTCTGIVHIIRVVTNPVFLVAYTNRQAMLKVQLEHSALSLMYVHDGLKPYQGDINKIFSADVVQPRSVLLNDHPKMPKLSEQEMLETIQKFLNEKGHEEYPDLAQMIAEEMKTEGKQMPPVEEKPAPRKRGRPRKKKD